MMAERGRQRRRRRDVADRGRRESPARLCDVCDTDNAFT